ncbi:MAG: hypothetical protein HY535_06805 [Chloroflexi bacterium]|nr:hypothetical protein [Chloroflexota bacterium]
MSQIHQMDERLWDWLKTKSGTFDAFGFNAQSITGSLDPEILDACWRLVAAGILRPTAGVVQFTVTAVGGERLQDAHTPYSATSYYQQLVGNASKLDDDARAYFRIALDCLKSTPYGAVALLRAALEAEIWSLVDTYEANSKQKQIRELHQRDLSGRISRLVTGVRSKGVIDEQHMDEFEACCTQIRISANRVLHPKGVLPLVDPAMVYAVSHSFRRMAENST